MKELAESLHRTSADMLGVQEHKIVHPKPIRYEIVNDFTLIMSKAWRNDLRTATEGVGILLNNRCAQCLANIKSHPERVLMW